MSEELWAIMSIYGPMVLMAVMFYFLLYRPQRAEQKRRADMLSTLHKGNKVITVGGIYGEIVSLEKGSLMLKVADKVVIQVTRNAISRNLTQSKAAKDEFWDSQDASMEGKPQDEPQGEPKDEKA